MRILKFLFAALLCGVLAQAQTTPDRAIDGAISREGALLTFLRSSTPVAETYIQDMVPDTDFRTIPIADHYFLGRIDLSHGIVQTSYLPKGNDNRGKFDLFTRFFNINYLPRGFAQMMLIDGNGFDRDHYQFQFLRREFLGEVRALVFAVTPLKGAGRGRFEGNIWIEDRDFNIVRFNGTYSGSSAGNMFLHFDSWRVNAGPDLWLPYESYSEESQLHDALKLHTRHFKALTRFWGYGDREARAADEFTNLTIETEGGPSVQDSSPQAADFTPVESLHEWQRLAEDNIVERFDGAGLVARRGGIDKVLETVVNNLEATNDLNITPAVRTRVLLSTPLESFTIGRTIVISRGMLDTLPDEASLAAILAHELAHIALGHGTSTDFAFPDRLRFDDEHVVQHFKMARTSAEEDAANAKAIEILAKSPYREKMGQAGLFLKALASESNRLPNLIKPLFGEKLVDGHNVLRLAALLERAPELQTTRTDQIAALPLGSRTRLNPWNDNLEMLAMHASPIASASEKMPFEITPVFPRLTYQRSGDPVPSAQETSTAGN